MEGEELPKKSGFKGKRVKMKFSHNVKRGADQKVSTTQQLTIPSQQLQRVEVTSPLIVMVASKTADRKPTKSELVGALKRAKVEIDQFTQQMDATNKMAEQQQKRALAWKEAAEDARKRKRAADSEVKASAKKMDSLSNILEVERSRHEEEILMAKADIKVQIITSRKCSAMFLWYCADLNYFFAVSFGFCVDVRKKRENTVQNKSSHLLENTVMKYKDCITFIAVN